MDERSTVTLHGPLAPRLRHLTREAARGAALLPHGAGAIVALLAGRPAATALRRLRADGSAAPVDPQPPGPRRPRILLYSVLTTLLGVLALVPLAVLVLFLLRGVFYGLVDPGPYDQSWGGPSLAGAWLAHLALGAVGALAGTLVLSLLSGLHRRMTARLSGGASPWWSLPVTVLACAAAVVLVVAWFHQI